MKLFSKTNFGRLMALLLLAFWALPALGQVSFRAALERDSIALGESTSLILTYVNGQPQQMPALPQVPNLAIAYVGNSSQTTIVNGVRTANIMLTFSVTPAQEGNYTIPAITVNFGGGRFTSQPLTLKVQKDDQIAAGVNKEAFLRLIVPKTNFYVGEIFPVEVQLYFTSAQLSQYPQIKGEGFVFGKPLEPKQSRAQVGNMIYNVVTFKMTASAAKAGTLELGPVELPLELRISVRQRARDPLEDFFGDAFGRYERRQVTLTNAPQTLVIKPIPTRNRPPGYGGAIGNFNFTFTASPTNVGVGDPITVRAAVGGVGNFDSVALPTINWREFTSYAATSTITNTDLLGLEGVKMFEMIVIPQNAEIKEIPSLAFSFFNPETETFKTVARPAIPLTVKASSSAPAAPSVSARGSEPMPAAPKAPDLGHIKPVLGKVLEPSDVMTLRPWFWGVNLIPVVAWLGVFAWRKRSEQLSRNPRLKRKKETDRFIQTSLSELAALAAQSKTDEFFALVFRVLQERLGERFNLPASAITESVVEDRIVAGGLAPETINDIHGLFQECNAARYAPVQSQKQLDATLERLKMVLPQLENLRIP